MPEIVHYVVRETREVRVSANRPHDAVVIASAAFEHGQNADCGVANGKGPDGIWGNTVSRIRTIEIWAEEKRP